MDEIYEEEQNFGTEEIEPEVEATLEPFMVEDEEDSDRVCLTCAKHKNGTKVCGILKPYRDFNRLHGKEDIEATFTCGEYEAEEVI